MKRNQIWSPETLNEFCLNPCWRDTEVLSETIFLKFDLWNLTDQVQKPVANFVNLHHGLTSVSLSLLACKMGIISNSSQHWYEESVSQSTKKHVIPGPWSLQKRSYEILLSHRKKWLTTVLWNTPIFVLVYLFLGETKLFHSACWTSKPNISFLDHPCLFDVGWLCVLFWRMACL